MALSVQNVWTRSTGEIWALIRDLVDITFSQIMLALRLFFSPAQFVGTLAEIPDLLIDRTRETPRRLIGALALELAEFPLDKKLRSRVMTADRARSWALTTMAEQIAVMADPPSRRLLRGVGEIVAGGGVDRLRERIEKRLGELTLSAQESLLARVLGTLASPARFALFLLKIWDLSVQIFLAVVGVVLLVSIYALWRSPQGIQDIKSVTLSQSSKRRSRRVLEESFIGFDSPLFSLRGPPYPRPPWSVDDVTSFSLTRRQYRVRT